MAFILLKVHFLKIISRDPRTKSGPGRTAIKKDENLRPGPDNFENYEWTGARPNNFRNSRTDSGRSVGRSMNP